MIPGGLIVTILIRLTLYIIYIDPVISSAQPAFHPTPPHPTPLKAIARGVLVRFI
jgi:hypothetical protein